MTKTTHLKFRSRLDLFIVDFVETVSKFIQEWNEKLGLTKLTEAEFLRMVDETLSNVDIFAFQFVNLDSYEQNDLDMQ